MRAAYRPAYVDSTAPLATINMTPLIDVLLVLLIMMILTVPMMTHKVPIDLPQPGPPPTDHRMTHRLDLDAAGALRLDGVGIAEAALPVRLAALRADPAAELQIAAAPEARYERFDQTLATIKRAGITRLGFVGNERFAQFDRPPAQR